MPSPDLAVPWEVMDQTALTACDVGVTTFSVVSLTSSLGLAWYSRGPPSHLCPLRNSGAWYVGATGTSPYNLMLLPTVMAFTIDADGVTWHTSATYMDAGTLGSRASSSVMVAISDTKAIGCYSGTAFGSGVPLLHMPAHFSPHPCPC